MTDPTANKPVPVGFGAVLLVLATLAGMWDKLQPMLDWLLQVIGILVLDPRAQGVFIGVSTGGGLAWRIPFYLPDRWKARFTRNRVLFYCSLLTLVMTFAFGDRSLAGFGCAVVAAIFGPLMLLYAIEFVYARLPHLEPRSLK